MRVNLIICLIFIMGLMAVSVGDAERRETPTQIDIIHKKYSDMYIDSMYGRYLFRRIIKIESNDGKYIVGRLDPSFGITQLKVVAVKDASEYWGIKIASRDDKIIWRLLIDKEYSIQIGAAYYGMLLKKFGDEKTAAIAYNLGISRTRELIRNGQELPLHYYEKL